MTTTSHTPANDEIRLSYRAGTRGPAGLLWRHERDDGRACTAEIPFRGHGAGRGEWTLLLEEPLTVTPALRCGACRAKAWLDGGRLRQAK